MLVLCIMVVDAMQIYPEVLSSPLFQLAQPGKLPDVALPTIQNSVNVADFSWDPFNTHRLVVGKTLCVCLHACVCVTKTINLTWMSFSLCVCVCV